MPRKSSIDLLPDEIRDALHALLRDPAVGQVEAAQRVNALLAAEGHDQRVSKSAVNRYSQRMDAIGEKMRQSRQIAEMWIGKLGNQPQGQVGKLLNEFTRTMAFETALTMSEGEDPVPPKLLKELSLAIKHLEEAASVNEKREREIRQLAAEEAAAAAETVAKQQGLTREGVKAIKEQILGIA
ncbi:DUF3486 family protein [Pontibacterium granulatum]|uniref:DUF3486 family protein n=1 Tax=Pontibacterium granulatum TaxID=2036029 RepID=UPI00249B1A67|nr:DUF3486 family protein [Pontibacterium granulatum]MDI3326767.1 DUF3486 family protein [Pontibacterium granulatum]